MVRRAGAAEAGNGGASVSCIYGIGSKEDYEAMVIPLRVSQAISRDAVLAKLVDLQYNRNDIAFERGQFKVGQCFQPVSDWGKISPPDA